MEHEDSSQDGEVATEVCVQTQPEEAMPVVDVQEVVEMSSQNVIQKVYLVEKPSQITTHVIDISTGVPASNVALSIYLLNDGRWTLLKESKTNVEGKCTNLISGLPGRYKLELDSGGYFTSQGRTTAFPLIDIIFDLASSDEKFHIPLHLSPYGYTTFRGC